jgi:hypothetical protein
VSAARERKLPLMAKNFSTRCDLSPHPLLALPLRPHTSYPLATPPVLLSPLPFCFASLLACPMRSDTVCGAFKQQVLLSTFSLKPSRLSMPTTSGFTTSITSIFSMPTMHAPQTLTVSVSVVPTALILAIPTAWIILKPATSTLPMPIARAIGMGNSTSTTR